MSELTEAVQRNPPDKVNLQRVLQGVVSATVSSRELTRFVSSLACSKRLAFLSLVYEGMHASAHPWQRAQHVSQAYVYCPCWPLVFGMAALDTGKSSS